MKFSVVIATKDRAGFLEHALASLEAQRDAPAFEVVVVDNASSDLTAELVAERARAVTHPLHYLFVGEPNRAAARNAGMRVASGDIVVFVDDDVWLPERFLFAHATAHARHAGAAVSGPILDVPTYAARPAPKLANYSGAFFCTCNVSVARASLEAVAGFDERFTLYGWEDTELGLRLRRGGVLRKFAWDAYLWHIKPPKRETLDAILQKTIERAQMAAHLMHAAPSLRTKLATGAYAFNFIRSTLMAPRWSLPHYRALASAPRLPAALRNLARAQLLDGSYRLALRRALAAPPRA